MLWKKVYRVCNEYRVHHLWVIVLINSISRKGLKNLTRLTRLFMVCSKCGRACRFSLCRGGKYFSILSPGQLHVIYRGILSPVFLDLLTNSTYADGGQSQNTLEVTHHRGSCAQIVPEGLWLSPTGTSTYPEYRNLVLGHNQRSHANLSSPNRHSVEWFSDGSP